MAQGRDAVASDRGWTRLQWRSHGPLPRLPQCQSLEHRGNHIACCDVYGEDADDVDRIPALEHKLRKFHAYVTSFRSCHADSVVGNSAASQRLEAWRRLHNEYDPTFKNGKSENPWARAESHQLRQNSKISELLLKIGWRRNVSTVDSRVVTEPFVKLKTTIGWHPCTSSFAKVERKPWCSKVTKTHSHRSSTNLYHLRQQSTSLRLDNKPVRIGTRNERKTRNAMEEQGRQVEVGHGQACHLLGLWEHLSHESRLLPQQRLGQRQRKSPAKLRKMAEVVTSLKMAPPTKVISQVRRAKRKANARTKACIQLKVLVGVNSSGKRIDSGNWHIISGRSLNGIQVQTIGETTTDSSKLAIFGTLDIPTVFGNTERPAYYCSTMARHGSSSITTWEQLRQHYRGKFAVPSVAKGVRTHRCERPGHALLRSSQVSEFGNRRNVEGHVRKVHTPLAFASETSRYHDAFIFEEFGGLIPRHSRVSGGLRREYHRLW